MNRSEAKELLPIIKAFAEGKGVETKTGSGWISIENMSFAGNPDSYRIKPEPEYRPFDDTEECWQEMQKHQPFGWVNYNGYRVNIAAVMGSAITFVNNKGYTLFFQQAFEECTFIDKQPFGIKEK